MSTKLKKGESFVEALKKKLNKKLDDCRKENSKLNMINVPKLNPKNLEELVKKYEFQRVKNKLMLKRRTKISSLESEIQKTQEFINVVNEDISRRIEIEGIDLSDPEQIEVVSKEISDNLLGESEEFKNLLKADFFSTKNKKEILMKQN